MASAVLAASAFSSGLSAALTAILSAGANPDYTDHWCDVLGLTKEEREVVRFYTALFCLDFMSEFGKVFNQDVVGLDLERLALLEKTLKDHLENAE